jgi:hypothetical protein
MSVANIIIQGLSPPEGFTHTLVTSSVLVTLRGPADDLERIDESSVRIVVDFIGVEITSAGRHRASAYVVIDGFDAVGAVENGYEVIIEIVPFEDDNL